MRWLGSSGALFVTEPKDLWPSGAEGENAMAQVVLWLACAYHSTLYTINHKQRKIQKNTIAIIFSRESMLLPENTAGD